VSVFWAAMAPGKPGEGGRTRAVNRARKVVRRGRDTALNLAPSWRASQPRAPQSPLSALPGGPHRRGRAHLRARPAATLSSRLVSTLAGAQSLEPRLYLPLPTGLSVIVASYTHSGGRWLWMAPCPSRTSPPRPTASPWPTRGRSDCWDARHKSAIAAHRRQDDGQARRCGYESEPRRPSHDPTAPRGQYPGRTREAGRRWRGRVSGTIVGAAQRRAPLGSLHGASSPRCQPMGLAELGIVQPIAGSGRSRVRGGVAVRR
jgi:hypothetical protein